jgi:hypothetical protein
MVYAKLMLVSATAGVYRILEGRPSGKKSQGDGPRLWVSVQE